METTRSNVTSAGMASSSGLMHHHLPHRVGSRSSKPFLPCRLSSTPYAHAHTAARALLPGYTFTRHICEQSDVASLRHLRDRCLSHEQLSFDPTPPHLSPLPASVLALSLGPDASGKPSEQWWAAFGAVAGSSDSRGVCREPDAEMQAGRAEARMKAEWLARWTAQSPKMTQSARSSHGSPHPPASTRHLCPAFSLKASALCACPPSASISCKKVHCRPRSPSCSSTTGTTTSYCPECCRVAAAADAR